MCYRDLGDFGILRHAYCPASSAPILRTSGALMVSLTDDQAERSEAVEIDATPEGRRQNRRSAGPVHLLGAVAQEVSQRKIACALR